MHEFTRHCLQPAEKRCSLPFVLDLLTTGCCLRKENKQA